MGVSDVVAGCPGVSSVTGGAQTRGRRLLAQQPSHWPGKLFVMVVLVRVTGLVAKMPPP